MKIEIWKGNDSKVYANIGPYAMNAKVVSEIEGYPILTDENYIWFVVFDGKEIIGFSALKLSQQSAEFTNDYVSPEYRKKGVHSKLIKERLSWCKENGIKYAKADCTNVCIDQYIKAGFKVSKSFVKWHKVERDV